MKFQKNLNKVQQLALQLKNNIMNLPVNGRIAIIDDQFKHAEPIIKVLSMKQLPHTYFSGEMLFLPEEDNNLNDIRVLFLDINLIDDSEHDNKVLKSRLIPVLNRVISKDNYPYVIIYWSRHEHHKKLLEEDIFSNELKNKKPIGFLSASKSSFFNLDGTPTEDIGEKIDELFDKVNLLIGALPAYSYLINWENQVHSSTDDTLQKVFSSYHSFQSWSDNANYLIGKFGKSYSGKSFGSQSHEEKIKSCFQAFNNVFIDSLEYSTNNTPIANPIELIYDEGLVNKGAILSINKNLLIAEDESPLEYPGAVTEDLNPVSDVIFKEVLNNSLSRTLVEQKTIKADHGKTRKEISTIVSKKSSEIRNEIRASWKKIYVVVTPLCDYVQGKYANCRVVKGMLIRSQYREYIDDKSEAIFMSPVFNIDNESYVMVVHFRYFFTINSSLGIKHLQQIFRIRQQLLAEIQSKLARHINRQGVLFLEE